MIKEEVPFQITIARRILGREGCESAVGGHVSVRAPGEDAFWVTPLEYFDETLPEHVIKVSMDLELLQGDWEPSPAVAFHASFYRARPDVNCVIHTHSHYAMVLATTGRQLGMYNDMASLFHDEQVIYIEDGIRPPVNGDLMSAEIGSGRVMILKNHGVIFLGDSIENTTVEAFTFEKCAQIHVEAEMIGGTEHAPAYIPFAKQGYRTFYCPQMWTAAVRRLKRDDPALFDGQLG